MMMGTMGTWEQGSHNGGSTEMWTWGDGNPIGKGIWGWEPHSEGILGMRTPWRWRPNADGDMGMKTP